MNANVEKKIEKVMATAELSCGLIMPISTIDGCSAEHWSDVKQILQDAIESIPAPKFTARLVSDADDVGVIQKRIVQGVYNSDIVVCDVSGRNANVMFELGMRLAFDRPTVIIKDDKTDYSFDTSIIEHLTYPRDLRFSKIVAFKKQLADKIVATYGAAEANPEHSTFLKSFGTFKIAHLDQKEAPSEQVILEMLQDMQKEMSGLRRGIQRTTRMSREVGVDTELVMALIKIKKENPQLVLEANDELIDFILDRVPEITKTYPTKRSFEEALNIACVVARSSI